MNAVLSLAAGFLLLLAGPAVADKLGDVAPTTLFWLGLGVLIFGVQAALVSTRRGLRKPWVLAFAYADLAWVAASAALMVFAPDLLSAAGRAVVTLSAVVVAWFAMAEVRAARKL